MSFCQRPASPQFVAAGWASPKSTAIYLSPRPRSCSSPFPKQTITTVGTIQSGHVPPQCGAPACVKKDCGFPWWILLILLVILVIFIIWAIWKTNQVKNAVVAPIAASVQQLANAANTTLKGISQAAGSVSAGFATGLASTFPNAINKVKYDDLCNFDAQSMPYLAIFTMNGCSSCTKAKIELAKVRCILTIPVFEVERNDIANNFRPAGYPYLYAVTASGEKVAFTGDIACDNVNNFVRKVYGPDVFLNKQ